MNPISKDIEKERLLRDCHRLDLYRGEKLNITRVVDLCLEEEMDIEDMEVIILDNCEVVNEVITAVEYLRSIGRLKAADYIENTVTNKIREMPMANIR